MSTFPTHVTLDQMKAAAEALGLPARDVTAFTVGASDGVTVTYHVRDDKGLRVTADGDAETATIGIPIGSDEPASGRMVAGAPAVVGEGGATCVFPVRTDRPDLSVTLEFDSSPEALARLRDALRGWPHKDFGQ